MPFGFFSARVDEALREARPPAGKDQGEPDQQRVQERLRVILSDGKQAGHDPEKIYEKGVLVYSALVDLRPDLSAPKPPAYEIVKPE